MKIELLFPLGWGDCKIPHLALPMLTGYLRHKHVEVTQRDLNMEMIHYMFSDQYRAFLLERLRKNKKEFKACASGSSSEREKTYVLSQKLLELPSLYQQMLARFKEYSLSNSGLCSIKRNPASGQLANILSTMYAPDKIDILGGKFMSTYIPGFLKHSYDFTLTNIFNHISHRERNFFWDIYTLFLGDAYKRKNNTPKIIGISFAREAQIISGLVLAHFIKEMNKNAVIVAGGAMIQYMLSSIRHYPGIFDVVDCFVVGEGEIPLLRIIEAVEQKRSFRNIAQTVSRHKKQIEFNPKIEELSPQAFPTPDFSDVQFERYLLPEKILPYALSRGCYWNKCAFCTLASSSSNYRVPSVQKIGEDLKLLVERYQCHHFSFVDECVHPKMVRAISEMLRVRKLRISWCVSSRIEKEFSPPTLKEAYRQGCKAISWGVESGSPKLLGLMRKGISVDAAKKVLSASHSAGIWNNCFILLSFPGETLDDFKKTIKFVTRNNRVLHSIDVGSFVLQPGSYVCQHPDEFGISIHPFPADYVIPALAFKYACERRYNVQLLFSMLVREANRLDMCPPVTWDYLLLLLSKAKRNKVQLFLRKVKKIEDALSWGARSSTSKVVKPAATP